ncbi:MAG: hypothetical protein B6245_09080 [Desulfobacteraceae bacterium 4572_88]|nr:MAG: hypothetical protein B6245_09080 [Desulfobacteraceae bacterium 4572_88]
MFFEFSFYVALFICLMGVLYRISNWFVLRTGDDASKYSPGQRLSHGLKAVTRALCTGQLIEMINVFVRDSLFGTPVYRNNFFRWLTHTCIFGGFVFLVVMHAFDDQITAALFPDYESTLNPFFFLRNLAGVAVLAGVAGAIYRRFASAGKAGPTTGTGDIFALILLWVIVFSGFLLEGTQIISAPIFDEMVQDYSGTDDAEEISHLRAYWSEEFGVVFSPAADTSDQNILSMGQELHEENCADCHSAPQSAFVSYLISEAISPAGEILNNIRFDIWLWYVHFISCFVGLAYLPFGKFFHLISAPINLMARSAEKHGRDSGPGRVTMRSLGLDACTHCGVCSEHCRVAPVFTVNQNENILPSEKLRAVKDMASGKKLGQKRLDAISEGSFACTGCHRCTLVCPSGIDLQDLWEASKQDLVRKGFPPLHVTCHKITASQWAEKFRDSDFSEAYDRQSFQIRHSPNLSDNAETFAPCVQCSICTSVCPVVAATENPSQDLDLTPQQVMNMLRLRLKDMAMGSRMVWNCLSCYMCQEHCPRGVKVTDVMYELRNLAHERFRTVREKEFSDFQQRQNLSDAEKSQGAKEKS